jgi:hypothetical protein
MPRRIGMCRASLLQRSVRLIAYLFAIAKLLVYDGIVFASRLSSAHKEKLPRKKEGAGKVIEGESVLLVRITRGDRLCKKYFPAPVREMV